VLHQIGVGALGPVFRTYEPTRDRLVAVKVFRLDITPEQAQALADELTRAAEAGLFHPSIVEPIAAGVQGTVAYRAEEYVPAESLDVAMRHYAPAGLDTVLPFITQLAGAIDFARAAGVGHGALHPRDIFVTPEEARATGFGVVDALERLGLRAPVRRPYSPPERIGGAAWGTPADVFSLAAIAFELLTSRRPSGTGAQIGALAPATGGQHAALVHSVLARAMDEDPAARYPNALAFAAALEAASRGDASEAAIPAAGAAATTSPVDQPQQQVAFAPVVPEIPDDIAAEREEDDANWELTTQEQRAAAEQEELAPLAAMRGTSSIDTDEPPSLFSDEAEAAAGDRLLFDAADLALKQEPGGQRFAEEFAEPPIAPTPAPPPPTWEATVRTEERPPQPRPERVTPVATSTDVIPPPRARPRSVDDSFVGPLSVESSGESRIVVEQPRGSAMLPRVLMLVVGLLVGFGLGYLVGSRVPQPETEITQNPATTQSVPPAQQPAQPQSQTPNQSQSPPAAPPAVPPDAPATGATSGRGATTPSAASEPRSGRLVVRSTPSGANVTLNGKWVGRTPFTQNALPFGNYSLRVVTDGYSVAQEEFSLSSRNQSEDFSLRLERTRAAPPPSRGNSGQRRATPPAEGTGSEKFTGTVFVDSRPQGAKVFIDGREYGTTPLRVPEVAIGSHVVRLELPDHRAWTNTIRVTAGQELKVTGSLEPIR
jgi:hypothetical protein